MAIPVLGRVQELCESRGGRPGRLSILMSLMVSVDLKQHWTTLRHWSQFVPNCQPTWRGHEALIHHRFSRLIVNTGSYSHWRAFLSRFCATFQIWKKQTFWKWKFHKDGHLSCKHGKMFDCSSANKWEWVLLVNGSCIGLVGDLNNLPFELEVKVCEEIKPGHICT